MGATTLYEQDGHLFTLLEGFCEGEMIPTNQVLIHDGDEAILLDPGGHKIHYELMESISAIIPINQLKYLFYSHQDPDIVSAVNAWLMLTDADAYISKIWIRFVMHFGVDELAAGRIKGIPDEGMRFKLGSRELLFLPAHFLHSSGNFQVYDPTSKILFSGDLGASIGPDYIEVTDFEDHIQYMEGFHHRYMPSSKASQQWARMVSQLDIEKIVPQHGAMFGSPEMSKRFIQWVSELPDAAEAMEAVYRIPA